MTGKILSFFTLMLAWLPACAQMTINTVAGGYVPSGVSAQNVPFGVINGITRDPNGNFVFCDDSYNVIRRINADGTIQTIAGTGVPGYGGDGGPAVNALLDAPGHPHYDTAGNLYFADAANYRIRRIDTSGVITTIAGTGIAGTLGIGGSATQAQLQYVADLALDSTGNLYIATTADENILRVTASGVIDVYATCSTCEQALQVLLAVDSSGNLYVSDQSQIFRISPDGAMQSFAGAGAALGEIIGLTVDSAGNVYMEGQIPAATGPFEIYRITPAGAVTVVAGTFTGTSQADGPALQTELVPVFRSYGLTADASGTVTFTTSYTLRQLTTQNTIQTLVPTNPQSAPAGTPAANTWFAFPNSIAFDGAGNLYIGQECVIQKIDTNGVLSTVAGTGQCSSNTTLSGPALQAQLFPINDIAVSQQGQVYFVDVIGALYQIAADGTLTTLQAFGQPSTKIAVNSQGHLYALSPGSTFGDITFNYPSIAVDASDYVYACCTQPNYTIDRFTPQLVGTTSVTVPGEIPPATIAVDASDTIWQGSEFGLFKGQIPLGASCCTYGDNGPAESAFIQPSAMAFAPNGDLYILDTNNGRIRRIHGSPATVPSIATGGIVNAASLAGGAIAPGELISIFGSNFGPAGLDVAPPVNNTLPTALNNVHVFFNGTAGRITARSQSQINVFVPYEVAGSTSTQVVVDVDTSESTATTVPVAPSAFGLSTADASGSGQGAIFNQDGTYNSHANPAAPGSIVTLFGTGEGVTTPALPDGALVISTPYSTTQAPVTVNFGSQTAQVQYAGAAPFLPTGVFQINATIPAAVAPGDVPITVSIGAISTTRTVTVAVK